MRWIYQPGRGPWGFALFPSLLPGSVGVRGRLWCCSCSQLCCTAPRPKCLPWLFLLMLLPIQTRQSFGLTKPPVSQMIFFSMHVKIFQAERVVFWGFFLFVYLGFFKCSCWRSINILEHRSHTYWHHQADWQWKGPVDWEDRFKSSLWTVACHVHVLRSDGFKGHCWALLWL